MKSWVDGVVLFWNGEVSHNQGRKNSLLPVSGDVILAGDVVRALGLLSQLLIPLSLGEGLGRREAYSRFQARVLLIFQTSCFKGLPINMLANSVTQDSVTQDRTLQGIKCIINAAYLYKSTSVL